MLFHHVRGPACGSTDRKEWSKQVDRQAQRVVHCGAVEIHVAVQTLALEQLFFERS
jgi:hypothetical protein